MAIKSVNETITQVTADNVIFETSGMYVQDSVSVKYVINGSEVPVVGVVEVGGNYIQLATAPSVGTVLRVYYDIRTSDTLDVDILQRLNALEQKVKKQDQMLELLTKALDNRVDKHTFRIWLKAMEQSFGKPILGPDILGIQQVHQSSND
jgi:hypothetical protein